MASTLFECSPQFDSLGLHMANVAFVVVDVWWMYGGGSVILQCQYEAGDPLLFSPTMIE